MLILLRRHFQPFLFQWGVHVGAWIPLLRIIIDSLRHNLTANPIQELTFRTGKSALALLVFSLAVTPAYTVFGYRPLLKVRRTLGLYAFFYVTLHFFVFVGVDYGFNLNLLREAIFEKRYALVGFAAGLILLPLAITSTKGWMARLGYNWKRLHRLVYLAGILAVVHYIWVVKSDIREPILYTAIVFFLLFLRLPWVRRRVGYYRSRWMVHFPAVLRGEMRIRSRTPEGRKM